MADNCKDCVNSMICNIYYNIEKVVKEYVRTTDKNRADFMTAINTMAEHCENFRSDLDFSKPGKPKTAFVLPPVVKFVLKDEPCQTCSHDSCGMNPAYGKFVDGKLVSMDELGTGSPCHGLLLWREEQKAKND